jgi:hypothetical protein
MRWIVWVVLVSVVVALPGLVYGAGVLNEPEFNSPVTGKDATDLAMHVIQSLIPCYEIRLKVLRNEEICAAAGISYREATEMIVNDLTALYVLRYAKVSARLVQGENPVVEITLRTPDPLDAFRVAIDHYKWNSKTMETSSGAILRDDEIFESLDYGFTSTKVRKIDVVFPVSVVVGEEGITTRESVGDLSIALPKAIERALDL